MIGDIKVLKCKYCAKKYKRAGAWFFRHFEKKHTGKKVACKEVIVNISPKLKE